MAYVIKRYSNRKLYDTQESRYVTLEEIEEMIRAGREISVVDAASGEDLTSVTLTQIILENERTHRANLPSAFLHQLIKHGEAWQEFVQRTMRSAVEDSRSADLVTACALPSSSRNAFCALSTPSLSARWYHDTGSLGASCHAACQRRVCAWASLRAWTMLCAISP